MRDYGRRGGRWLAGLGALALLVSAAGCSTEAGDEVLVTVQPTGAVVVLVDNCPAVGLITTETDGATVWAIERTREPLPVSALEVTVGEAPEGWLETIALDGPLTTGVHRVEVDGVGITFTIDDLAVGQTFDGSTSAPLGPLAEDAVDCDEADEGGIEGFGDFALTGLILLVVGLLVFALVAWGVVRLLQLIIERRDIGTPADPD